MRRTRFGTVSLVGCFLTTTLVSGCGLTSAQHVEIKRWEAEAIELGHPEIHFEEDLNPSTAAGLGFLPFGVGGFYVRRPGLGVSGILVWPISIMWVPAVAYKSAHYYNYDQLRQKIKSLRAEVAVTAPPEPSGQPVDVEARLAQLNTLWKEGKISDAEYHEARRNALEQLTR